MSGMLAFGLIELFWSSRREVRASIT